MTRAPKPPRPRDPVPSEFDGPAKPYGVYVISAGRPTNVPHMQTMLAPDEVTWVVPHSERHEYAQTGAHHVLPVAAPPPGEHQLTTQRRAAHQHAAERGLVCIQSDDDAKSFRRVVDGKSFPVAWAVIRQAMLAAFDGDTHLVGFPPTNNAYFARGKQLDYGFILASLCATDVATPTWDTNLPLKEDYDLTCRHLDAYGRVARLDMYVVNYDHYTNRGGVVAQRTPKVEKNIADLLVCRWPRYLKHHPTRSGELSFIPQRTAMKAAPNPGMTQP